MLLAVSNSEEARKSQRLGFRVLGREVQGWLVGSPGLDKGFVGANVGELKPLFRAPDPK